MTSKKQTLKLIRQLFNELRYHEQMKTSRLEHLSWRKSPVYQYVRHSSLNSKEDYTNLEYYITLLHGSRVSQELIAQYRGVGERSVEETARIVGLKLPKLYQDKE